MLDSQQYRKLRKKRLNNFLLFYLFIVLFLCFNLTFSRYGTMGQVNASLSVAEWKIKVNNENIDTTKEFLLNNTQTTVGAQTKDNKIAPNSKGYFDIIIDCEGTEVSIDYKIVLDKSILESNGINLDLTGYSINDGADVIVLENDTIEGEILLNKIEGKTVKFTKADNLKLRIYWDWNQDIENPKFTNESLKIITHVTIKQKIGVE